MTSLLFTTTSDPVIGYPFTISPAAIDEVKPAVAYDPLRKEYLVVWQNVRSVTNDIYAQRISEQGQLLSWFFIAEGNSPELAFNPKNNTYLVEYDKWVSTDYDVYARRVDFTGPLGPEFPIAFNLNETELSPVVAYKTHPNYDEFLVAWENIPPPPTTINRVEGQRVAGTAGGGDAGGETIASRLSIAHNSDYNLDPGTAIAVDEMGFLPTDFLIKKRRYSAFFGTDFEILLRGLKIDTLLLCGAHTDVCVHYTFVDGHQSDYFCRVIEDCVAGSSVEAHEASLRAMEYLQTGARCSLESIIEAMENISSDRTNAA